MPAIGDTIVETSAPQLATVVCCCPSSKSQLSAVVCDTPATLCQLSNKGTVQLLHAAVCGSPQPGASCLGRRTAAAQPCSFSPLPASCLPLVMQCSKDPLHSVQKSFAAHTDPCHSCHLLSATHQAPSVSFEHKGTVHPIHTAVCRSPWHSRSAL